MKYYFFRDTDSDSNLLDGKTYHAAGYVEKLFCELGKPNRSGKDLAVSFFLNHFKEQLQVLGEH